MFARLLGLERSSVSAPTPAAATASVVARQPRRARRTPALPEKNFIPEIEFDRRVTYWSMTRTEPPTATVRTTVFENHTRIALETHPVLENARHQMLINARHLANKIIGLPVILGDQAIATLKAVATHQHPSRTSVVVARFEDDLAERLAKIDNVDIRDLIDYVGLDRIVAITVQALRDVSQEYILAIQLKQTARTIRRLEDLLSRSALPEEDLFELKLRRDVFGADLRALTRLVRTTLRR